jgi:methyl-accepting chemotaxis protein
MSSLLELSGSIEDITQRVNILGLNAAIEAARAGSLGKGFSVIASEIRKLAETTQTNTKQISDAVSSLLASVKDSESAGRLTSETFRQLDQGIRTVLASYQDIAASMEVLGREKDAILGIVKN